MNPSGPSPSPTTTLTLHDFWASIDAAWAKVEGHGPSRLRDLSVEDSMARGDPTPRYSGAARTIAFLPAFLNHLEAHLRTYTPEQLRAWDRHYFDLMRRLDALQLQIHLMADTPKKVLMARAFIVLAGQRFYRAFELNAWSGSVGYYFREDMPHFARKVYEEQFGAWNG